MDPKTPGLFSCSSPSLVEGMSFSEERLKQFSMPYVPGLGHLSPTSISDWGEIWYDISSFLEIEKRNSFFAHKEI